MSTVHFTDIHGHSWLCTQKEKDWIEAFQAEALRRGHAQIAAGKPLTYIQFGLDILQIIGGAVASAGTHLVDPNTGEAVCIDIANVSYDMIALAREMGGDASWHRKKNWDGKGGGEHGHLNLRGLTNRYANYQYSSTTQGVDHGHNGLASRGKDDGPKPLSKRTYKQGIDHAKALAAAAADTPPPPPPVVIPDTALKFGYWNLFGTYLPTEIDKARFRAQIGLMRAMKVSLLVALELHEENGSKGMLAFYKLELAKYGFAVAEGKGGNHLIYDPKKYEILSGANKSMGSRWASKWNVRRIDTTLPFWVAAFHTPAGSTPARVLARSRETKAFLAWIANLQRVLIGIDKNNDTDRVGTPTRQLRAAGMSSLYDVLAIENEKFRSHHDYDKAGRLIADEFHIDDIGGGRLVTFTGGKQWQTGALADHDALEADVIIKGIAA